jgi:hypothetical protein
LITEVLRDQPITHTVQSLQVKLTICLDRNESHVLTIHCLGNRRGIDEVVLVGLRKL